MRRIGIYAGTFDPVHQGHISFCVAAKQDCNLDEVMLIPEEQPRGKQHVSPLRHRTALLRLATQAIPGLSVHTLRSKQFTISKTWPEIQRHFPDAHITLLIGADVVVDSLKHWQGLAGIIPETTFAVGLRDGFVVTDIQNAMQELSAQLGIVVRYTVVQTLHPHVASSYIRQGRLDHVANELTARYIRQHRLYRQTYDGNY